MKKIITGLVLLIVMGGCSAQKKTKSGKWIKLFNGKDLNDWTVKIKDHPMNDNWGNTFRVENGVMKVSYDQYDGFKEQFGHIYYNKKFAL